MRAALVAILAVPGCVNDYVVRDDDGEVADDAADDGADPFECMPCESDLECGDAWDRCVALDVVGLHCLFACPEAGCPEGLTCRMTLSVDEVASMQCAPQQAACSDDD